MKRFLNTAPGKWMLCLLSGAVFSLPYFFEFLFPLTFLSLIFFFYLMIRKEAERQYLPWFAFFLGFYTPLYSWFSALYPLEGYGLTDMESLLLVFACCILLPIAHALLSALVLSFGKYLPQNPWMLSAGYASLWVIHEWICTLGELAFPWGTIALSQTGFTPYIKDISVIGTFGIAWLTVFFCYLFTYAASKRKWKILMTSVTILLVSVTVGGIFCILPKEESESVSFALVQGNATTEEKWTTEKKRANYLNYLQLTEEAAKSGAQLIVLPESAIAASFEENGPLHQAFANISKQYHCTIVMGVLESREDGVHNCIIAIDGDGNAYGTYEKQHLVPFGESFPFKTILSTIFPQLTNINLSGSSLVTTDCSPVLETDLYRIGCLICFDSIFPSAETAAANPEFYVVCTNDSWFKDSSAIGQHLRYSKLRAIESGKSVLRAANTGISALITADGTVVSATEVLTEDILYGQLNTSSSRTIYSILGNIFLPISVILLFCIYAYSTILWRRTHENSNE